MRIRTLAAALTCATMVVVSAERADGSPVSLARTQDGYALAYHFQFAACVAGYAVSRGVRASVVT